MGEAVLQSESEEGQGRRGWAEVTKGSACSKESTPSPCAVLSHTVCPLLTTALLQHLLLKLSALFRCVRMSSCDFSTLSPSILSFEDMSNHKVMKLFIFLHRITSPIHLPWILRTSFSLTMPLQKGTAGWYFGSSPLDQLFPLTLSWEINHNVAFRCT